MRYAGIAVLFLVAGAITAYQMGAARSGADCLAAIHDIRNALAGKP